MRIDKIIPAFIATMLIACGGGNGAASPNSQTPAFVLQLNGTISPTPASEKSLIWQNLQTGNENVGISCLRTEAFHIHAQLRIFIDGNPIAIPGDVGRGNCTLELHTHDLTGLIHIEAESTRDFTLGQFLSIWRVPYTALSIGKDLRGYKIFSGRGNALPEFKGSPDQLVLFDHQQIVIIIGAAPTDIPVVAW